MRYSGIDREIGNMSRKKNKNRKIINPPVSEVIPFRQHQEISAVGSNIRTRLRVLVAQVVSGRKAYGELAELIENRAYDEWKRGRFERVIEELQKVSAYFEAMENKNEENTLDLAEVYLLIGQFFQYAERFPESIEWFSKSVLVNDGNSIPYHAMGDSYLKIGNLESAIRCFEQELSIDQGNYFTYLTLAELYDRQGTPEDSEDILKRLLIRDPENIQGLHRLIRHYERFNPSIDVGLLRKRLVSLGGKHTWITAAIRSFHLESEKRHDEAIDFLSKWQAENNGHASPVIHLVKTMLYEISQEANHLRREVGEFIDVCRSRQEVMRGHIEEFESLFGEPHSGRLKRRLQAMDSLP